jgi:hypothetical protein
MVNIDDILEQCLQRVASGRATADDCLRDYPQQADVLRPLLRTALEIHRLDRPRASREAFDLGQLLMMEAAAQRTHDRGALQVVPSQLSEWLRGLVRPKDPAHATWGKLAAVGALGVATLLVWVMAAGLLVRAWRSVLVPQTCTVAYAEGVAQVQAYPEAAWQNLARGQVLRPGYRIRTGDPSSVTIRFFDGGTTSLGPNTELLIEQLGKRRDGSSATIVLGQPYGLSQNRVESAPETAMVFEVTTPSASVVANGTGFKVRVDLDYSTSVVVLDGAVTVTGGEATVTLSGGQMTTVEVDQAPEPVVLAPAEELVEMPSGPGQVPAPTETSGGDQTTAPEASPTEVTGVPTPAPTSTTVRTATPEPPTPEPTQIASPTARPAAPTDTEVPAPPAPPTEVVEVYLALYNRGQEELQVKARTNVPGCTLTLVGFGPMVIEGDHWLYVAEGLHENDVPSRVTVRSSCGGSDSSPVS